MSNVRLTWTLPSVGATQREIEHTRIEFRVDGAPQWTEQTLVPTDVAQELLFQDVAPGTYFYRATVVDIDGNEGAPAETQVDVPYDPPGTVVDFAGSIE